MAPRFSIVTPVYNPPHDALRDTITSVRAQTFEDWEWCIVDDVSPDPEVRSILAAAAADDPRIRVLHRVENGGISRATNDAIAMATGEFIAFLDHDDLLVPQALAAMWDVLEAGTIDFAYSDEAILTPAGFVEHPFYKPDWSPTRMRSQMYTCHFMVISKQVIDAVGGLRPDFDGSQDYDLVLRVSEHTDRIAHLSQVLYLWRSVPGSAADSTDAKPWAFESGQRAVQDHCDRLGIPASVEMTTPGIYRLRYTPNTMPLVSIVIPTCGASGRVQGEDRVHLTHALRSIMDRTTYPDFEIVLVADRHTPAPVLADAAEICGDRMRVSWFDGPFNFSAKINQGVADAVGAVVVLLNDDVELLTPEWLEEFVGRLEDPEVGLVGAKLYFEDDTIQHAGHLYISGSAHHPFRGYHRSHGGVVASLVIDREVSGNTAAACALRRDAFDAAGGMDINLPNSYNDVDFSLRVREAGYRNLWTPFVELYHFESMSREPTVQEWEFQYLRDRWGDAMYADPFFNPNMSLHNSGYVVAVPAEEYIRDLRWSALA